MSHSESTVMKTVKTSGLTEEEKLEISYQQYRKIEAEQIARCQLIDQKKKELGIL